MNNIQVYYSEYFIKLNSYEEGSTKGITLLQNLEIDKLNNSVKKV